MKIIEQNFNYSFVMYVIKTYLQMFYNIRNAQIIILKNVNLALNNNIKK